MTKSFYTLSEAYHQVYQPQDVNEDFNDWVNFLIQEGYDLDEYSDEELLDAYYGGLDEANKGDEYRTKGMPQDAARFYKVKRRVSSTTGTGTRGRRLSLPSREDGNYYLDMQSDKKNPNRIHIGGLSGIREEVDLYDIISEYLVSEGFCESYEDADVIMANMSEEWRESILDEAKGTILSVTSPKGERRRARFDPIDRFVTPYRNLEKSQLKSATQQAKNEREEARLMDARRRNLHRATHRSERGNPQGFSYSEDLPKDVQSGRQRLARRAKGR
jgi:hypothetical protein